MVGDRSTAIVGHSNASVVGDGSIANVGDHNVIDNSTTVVNNTFVLLPLGLENRFHVYETDTMTKLLRRVENGIIDVIYFKHFSKDHPENHNLRCTNIKSPWMYVFNKERKWELRLKKEVFDKLTEDARADLLDHYHEVKGDITKIPIFRAGDVKRFAKALDADTVKTSYKSMNVMVYNATKELQDSARSIPPAPSSQTP